MKHHGSENYSSVPVMDEAMIRQLPSGHALLLQEQSLTRDHPRWPGLG